MHKVTGAPTKTHDGFATLMRAILSVLEWYDKIVAGLDAEAWDDTKLSQCESTLVRVMCLYDIKRVIIVNCLPLVSALSIIPRRGGGSFGPPAPERRRGCSGGLRRSTF